MSEERSIPTLHGIPVLVYFDEEKVAAILGKHESVTEAPSSPAARVFQYAWDGDSIGMVTYQEPEGEPIILGVRSRSNDAVTDRGLKMNDAQSRIQELYPDAKPTGDNAWVVEYTDYGNLVIHCDGENTVSALQLLSVSLLG